MPILPKLISLYTRRGIEISGGPPPWRYANHPYSAYTFFLRNGKSLTNGLGISFQEIYFLECLFASYRPQTIFGVGNSWGWSSLALALLNPDATTVVIDACLDENTDQGLEFTRLVAKEEGLPLQVLNGTSPGDVDSIVQRYLGRPVDFAFIDGGHSAEQVLADFSALLPFTTSSSMFLFHDAVEFGLMDGIQHAAIQSGLPWFVLDGTTSGMAMLYDPAHHPEAELAINSFRTPPSFKEIVAQWNRDPGLVGATRADEPIRKWYFATNERGLEAHFEQIVVALWSCLERTSLEPHLLYNGPSNPRLKWLAQHGVTVHPHRLPFDTALEAAYGPDYRLYSGHWLRTQIPFVEVDDDFVLYTDYDVMFLSNPSLSVRPSTIAMVRDTSSSLNSGVMVMNLPKLREAWPALRPILAQVLQNQITVAHDQVFYNLAFEGSALELDARLNWRVTQGINSEAEIVHFQISPKPSSLHEYYRDPTRLGTLDALGQVAMYPAEFAYYQKLYTSFLTAAQQCWGLPPYAPAVSFRGEVLAPHAGSPVDQEGRVLLWNGQEDNFASVDVLHGIAKVEKGSTLRLLASTSDPALLLPSVDGASLQSIEVALTLKAPAATAAQLYFMIPGSVEYNEPCSVRHPVSAGVNSFTLPVRASAIEGRLRLDPGAVEGEYEITRIEIRGVILGGHNEMGAFTCAQS